MKKARDNGFFVTYNHPTWSREGHEDYNKYNFMHAMEVFNSECEVLGYCEYNEYVRVTITDATGKQAYTNAYFVDDLFE